MQIFLSLAVSSFSLHIFLRRIFSTADSISDDKIIFCVRHISFRISKQRSKLDENFIKKSKSLHSYTNLIREVWNDFCLPTIATRTNLMGKIFEIIESLGEVNKTPHQRLSVNAGQMKFKLVIFWCSGKIPKISDKIVIKLKKQLCRYEFGEKVLLQKPQANVEKI